MQTPKVSYGPGFAGVALTAMGATIAQGIGYTGGQTALADPPATETRSAYAGGPMTITDALLKAEVAGAEARSEAKINALGGRIDTLGATVAGMKDKLDDIAGNLASVPTDLAALKVRVDHLPSKDFIVKAVVGGGALLGALSVFAPKLQALLGITN